MNKSKKITALLLINILLVIFCAPVTAQIDDESEGLYIERPKFITVGAVAGANFCQVDGDNYAGYRKIAFNFGGIGYLRLYRHLALSFELLYSQKGARSDYPRYSKTDSTTLITKYDVNLNYAEIPIMINYFDKHKSHFGAGISYSRLVSSSESMSAYPAYSVDFSKFPFRENGYDLLLAAKMHIWKGLFMNLRFQYALSPVRTVSPAELARAQKQYSNLWSVRVMYLFR